MTAIIIKINRYSSYAQVLSSGDPRRDGFCFWHFERHYVVEMMDFVLYYGFICFRSKILKIFIIICA